MSDPVEVKVKVSNEEQKYTRDFLCYEPITISKEDPQLLSMVEQAVKEFNGEVGAIKVNFTLVWE